jgi:DNA-directed RNA polymerase subunit RPC12/RpoP
MSLLFKCLCGRTLRVQDERSGRKVRCPACGEILTAPQPSLQKEAEVLDAALSGSADDALQSPELPIAKTDATEAARPCTAMEDEELGESLTSEILDTPPVGSKLRQVRKNPIRRDAIFGESPPLST